MKINYGITPRPVLKILMPHPYMMKFGVRPSISFPVLGPLEYVNGIREWCNENFAHDHHIITAPMYDSYGRNAGYSVSIMGDEEDLLIITMSN